ncbi:puromycin-sensitive aminopeptidase-like protein isoform X2 [Tanacetum coccineum]
MMTFKQFPLLPRKYVAPLEAISNSLADLQLAKDNFFADNLIGEGSTGCVFHAQFEDGKMYEKGAEVVRMYQTLLGNEGFCKGTNLYFQMHEGQAVTNGDFFAAM